MPKVSGLTKSYVKHLDGHIGKLKDRYLAMPKADRMKLVKDLKKSGDPEQELLGKLLEAIKKDRVSTPRRRAPAHTSGGC